MSKFQFETVALGGTFDRLHKGHEELLKTAFSISESVIIGITTKRLTKHKTFSHLILPYQTRKKEVAAYLGKHNVFKRSRIVPLYDPYGPLLKNKKIEAVVVGPRADKDVLQKLKGKIKIIHCQTIRSEDDRYLSSTRIRKGEISREGYLYLKNKGPFFLPFFLRERLKKPFGTLTKMQAAILNNTRLIISVGDASTRWLNQEKVRIGLSVVDFKIRRKQVIANYSDLGFPRENDLLRDYRITKVKNSPGTISSSLIEGVKTSLNRLIANKKREIIKIDGEEDLAVIPIILYAPLETMIVYGQPSEGLVRVVVTEEVKKMTKNLLSRFQKTPIL